MAWNSLFFFSLQALHMDYSSTPKKISSLLKLICSVPLKNICNTFLCSKLKQLSNERASEKNILLIHVLPIHENDLAFTRYNLHIHYLNKSQSIPFSLWALNAWLSLCNHSPNSPVYFLVSNDSWLGQSPLGVISLEGIVMVKRSCFQLPSTFWAF